MENVVITFDTQFWLLWVLGVVHDWLHFFLNLEDRKFCELESELGELRCLAYIPKFRYNAENETCEQYIYGGCNKTENLFDTKEDCEKICGGYKKAWIFLQHFLINKL